MQYTPSHKLQITGKNIGPWDVTPNTANMPNLSQQKSETVKNWSWNTSVTPATQPPQDWNWNALQTGDCDMEPNASRPVTSATSCDMDMDHGSVVGPTFSEE